MGIYQRDRRSNVLLRSRAQPFENNNSLHLREREKKKGPRAHDATTSYLIIAQLDGIPPLHYSHFKVLNFQTFRVIGLHCLMVINFVYTGRDQLTDPV